MNKTLSKRKVKRSFKERILLKYLVSNNEKFLIERNQHMAVFANDWIGSNIFSKGVFERDEIEDLINILNDISIDTENATALDIGANIGNHSIQFAKYFKHVEAFEPNPKTFVLLEFNCINNENISCHNFGLGNKDENLTLYEDLLNIGASSIYSNDRNKNYNHYEIKIFRIDSLLNKFSNVKLIKIDVEGMESEVILGALKTIRKYKPVIVFEQFLKEFKAPAKETKSIDLVRSLGYEIFWLKNNNIQTSWLFRRIKNVYQIFFGDTQQREIITNNNVSPGYYSMLYAIHKDNLQDFY